MVAITNNIVPNDGMTYFKIEGGVRNINVHQSFEMPFSIILMFLPFHRPFQAFHNLLFEIQCTDKYQLTLTLLYISYYEDSSMVLFS